MFKHVTFSLVAVALAAPGCSKKREDSSAGTGSAPGSATTGSAAAPEQPAPALAAAEVTKELFLAEPPKFVIEALERGLWISVNSNAFEHSCRAQVGIAMVRAGKIRDAAKAAPDAVTCETKDAYAVCTFAPADADKNNPDSRGAWIFVKDEAWKEPVLAAVVVGDFDWAKVAPAIPPKTPCPKPSMDPQ
jgi:hypothetical protein